MGAFYPHTVAELDRLFRDEDRWSALSGEGGVGGFTRQVCVRPLSAPGNRHGGNSFPRHSASAPTLVPCHLADCESKEWCQCCERATKLSSPFKNCDSRALTGPFKPRPVSAPSNAFFHSRRAMSRPAAAPGSKWQDTKPAQGPQTPPSPAAFPCRTARA
jgi:hypothetical protein